MMRWFLPLLVACAPSIDPNKDDTDIPIDSDEEVAEQIFTHEDSADGVTLTTADSRRGVLWRGLDLDDPAVTSLEPTEDVQWDIALSRFKVMINGGHSGDGGVEIVPLFGQDFDALTEVPDDGWIVDRPDDEDENEDPEYAFEVWFDYDSQTHFVSPADVVFAVRSTSGSIYKLEFMAYYDDAGTAGYPMFRWAALP